MSEPIDLWWQARQKTAATSRPGLIAKTKAVSFPNRATTLTMAALNPGRAKSGIIVDLNKYRAGRDLQKFVDAGVDGFALRMGGPAQWIMDNWRYTEDVSFRPYMEQLDRLGMLNRTIGYIIHNPFEIWKTEDDVHINLINQWTGGGYLPAHLTIDHEVSECWRGGVKIKATGYNLVGSLASITEKMVRRFSKKVSIYTARWFINSNYPADHNVYFDNINRPEVGKQRLMWMAWYPQTFTKEYADFQTTLDELIVPNGTQLASYLNVGNYSNADLWQFSDRIKLPGDTTGVDCNITMGSLDEFNALFGLGAPVVPPVVEPPVVVHDHSAEIAKLQEVIKALGG